MAPSEQILGADLKQTQGIEKLSNTAAFLALSVDTPPKGEAEIRDRDAPTIR